jgi:hypothetical protein
LSAFIKEKYFPLHKICNFGPNVSDEIIDVLDRTAVLIPDRDTSLRLRERARHRQS